MKAGVIAPGEVDERSIEDVQPGDLRGFSQCHFFAGIGVWSYALRLAGWPDDRPVWTGSCPCPPFSVAGKKKKCPKCKSSNLVPCPRRTGYFVCCRCSHAWFADARHLWPEMWRLVSRGRPVCVFGEQVAGSDGEVWLTAVRASLEILGYRFWPAGLNAAGFGAPHIRQRLYFVADAGRDLDAKKPRGARRTPWERFAVGSRPKQNIPVGRMADAERDGGWADEPRREAQGREVDGRDCATGRMADAAESRRAGAGEHGSGPSPLPARPEQCGNDGELADAGKSSSRLPVASCQNGELADAELSNWRAEQQEHGDAHGRAGLGRSCHTGELGDASGPGLEIRQRNQNGRGAVRLQGQTIAAPGFTNGPDRIGTQRTSFWADAEWLWCRDGKWRAVEPGTFPLAHGLPVSMARMQPEVRRLAEMAGLSNYSLKRAKSFRIGSLRGYGNALCAPVAQGFIEAYMESSKTEC